MDARDVDMGFGLLECSFSNFWRRYENVLVFLQVADLATKLQWLPPWWRSSSRVIANSDLVTKVLELPS